MFSATDEDDLFNPAARYKISIAIAVGQLLVFYSSNLASLFTATMKPPENTNESLVYTAPRQPKPATSNESPKSKLQSSVLCAKVVTLYKRYCLLLFRVAASFCIHL